MPPLEINSKKLMSLELNRILNRDLFIYILDLEVKRARRYQNFICLLFIKLKKYSNEANNNGLVFQTCYETLSDLLIVEMRESDILGSLGEGQLVALLPYSDKSAGICAKSRFEGVLKYFDFKNKGYEVEIDPICFPLQGTDTIELLKKSSEAKQ
jgi:GGDEF domain-containing protein